jgi:putative transposase
VPASETESFVNARDQRRGGTLFRTFKEQVVHGSIYQTIDDVRAAVHKFFDLCNAEWLVEKNGLRSPRQTRIAWENASMKQAA